ncbi:MAG TPA: UbiA family prenyltransferase [Anaerolineales bacterium]|nr:UbiA family prenyltransferase [Anaerolineales bacterium]
MQRLLIILRLARPLLLLLAALTYVLGTGVARYLGHPLSPTVFWLGLVGVLLAQASMSLLVEVFRPANEPIFEEETIIERRAVHDAALYVSLGALAAASFIAYALFRQGDITPPALTFLGLSLVALIVYSVPPVRLYDKGLGELLLALHLAYIIPTIAFLLQSGDYHRLLNAVIIPLTFLAFASFLALDFPTYADDLKYERRTLLVHIGWERAVPLHHGLIIAGYLLFAAAPLFGFSLGLLWPAFLTLPFATLEIFWLRNIALGAKPIWTMLSANAISLFGLTAYFLTIAFWLR